MRVTTTRSKNQKMEANIEMRKIVFLWNHRGHDVALIPHWSWRTSICIDMFLRHEGKIYRVYICDPADPEVILD